jgi:hypothetical protein
MSYNTNTRIQEITFLLEVMLELRDLSQGHNTEVLNEEIARYKYLIELEEKKT